jgi:flagellar biosynthetic protein FliP
MSATAHVGHASGKGHFLRHLGEMTLVMMLGMALLGGIVRGAAAAAGVDYADVRLRLPAVAALVMALNMSAPMAWWMRRRGHGWGYTVEMSAAMFVPVLALIPALWVGAISAETLSAIQHAVMIPSMMIVMVHRRGELAR